jgi:hypothetical protein
MSTKYFSANCFPAISCIYGGTFMSMNKPKAFIVCFFQKVIDIYYDI